jgi:crossover junction endodeoxyribonuclease RusA
MIDDNNNNTVAFTCDFVVPSANTYYRKFRNVMVLSKKGREFKQRMLQRCRGMRKLHGPVCVYVTFYWKERRHRDLDNYFKALLDATKNVIFEDDDQVVKIIAAKYVGVDVPASGFSMAVTTKEEAMPKQLFRKLEDPKT